MKKINVFRILSKNYLSLFVDKKKNPELKTNVCLSYEKHVTPSQAEKILKRTLEKVLGFSVNLNVEELGPEKLRSYSTEQLRKIVGKKISPSAWREHAEEILRKRENSVPSSKTAPAEKEAVKKEAVKKEAVKKEAVKKEAVKKEAVKKEAVKKEAVKKEAEREYKKCMPAEKLQERLEVARTQAGKYCQFRRSKSEKEEFGLIRSARLDKRSGFIQYRIEILASDPRKGKIERTGKICGKGDDSQHLTIFS